MGRWSCETPPRGLADYTDHRGVAVGGILRAPLGPIFPCGVVGSSSEEVVYVVGSICYRSYVCGFDRDTNGFCGGISVFGRGNTQACDTI
jgi:hypothetical protein